MILDVAGPSSNILIPQHAFIIAAFWHDQVTNLGHRKGYGLTAGVASSLVLVD